ncbi:putative membrane-bound O-acyltransferase C24H6.01c isoform X5 [Citrus clementina]|uniref:putative membrane-bound O-acyltransferase C24H6.01c isoform X5 n=1 Tax=Citrus clementina TaxID=85681 RepID=UPI000CED580D|nr:putative membrane-bound O-acyltransferase C24H6.01c isoform X5 [Citrus x clementina]
MLNETKMKKKKMQAYFSKGELMVWIPYAIAFYVFIIRRSLQISHDHFSKLYGLRPGWLFSPQSLNDVSDAQWRNFRSNLPILTVVFILFAVLANTFRTFFNLKARGMSILWLFISFIYLFYLHGACVIFILSIASLNFLLVKSFARRNCFPFLLWIFNIFFLIFNRVYEGYSFSIFGQHWAYLDNFRGTFRWHICFNFVILRMISFGYDYHWAQQGSHFDHEKHVQRCHVCKSGKLCYQIQQERNISENYALAMYLCYLVYAPLYISGPIISFNAFASQLEVPQNNYLRRDVLWYGLRWIFSLLLMELMTHIFYYNAFAIRKLLSWAWLTCLFFIPEMVVKSAADSFQAESAFGRFLVRELRAFAGSITITCLMIANLVGYVIGPSGVNWLMSQFLTREGLPVLGGMFLTFYVGTKLMFQISDAKQRKQ